MSTREFQFLRTALVVLFATFLFSCNGVKHIERSNLIDLNTNMSFLEGKYENMDPDVTKNVGYHSPMSLWSVLVKKGYKTYGFEQDTFGPNSTVQLTVLSKKRVLAKLFVDTTLVAERVVKGRVKNDYFSVTRKIRYVGLPVLFMLYSNRKIELGKTEEGELIVDVSHRSLGWLVFMVAGNTEYYNLSYREK